MYAYLIAELASADSKYNEKLESSESNTKALFDAGWKVEELNRLVDHSQSLIATVSRVIDMVADPVVNLVDVNIARWLSNIRETISSFVRDLSRHQRVAATHIFVMMISSEQRNIKPYVIPVQCLPYHSITTQQMRNIVSQLIKEMVSRGMKVAGE